MSAHVYVYVHAVNQRVPAALKHATAGSSTRLAPTRSC